MSYLIAGLTEENERLREVLDDLIAWTGALAIAGSATPEAWTLLEEIQQRAAALQPNEGWTPPEVVDPDIAEAVKLANEYAECDDWPFLANWFLKAIRRGRELERAVMGNPIPEQIQEVTPPEPVNPDLLLARKIEAGRLGVPPTVSNAILHGAHDGDIEIERTLETIKRGRELERAEAEPGMVWVKHDGSGECPISVHQPVLITNINGFYGEGLAGAFYWNRVTHYAVITPPEDVA